MSIKDKERKDLHIIILTIFIWHGIDIVVVKAKVTPMPNQPTTWPGEERHNNCFSKRSKNH